MQKKYLFATVAVIIVLVAGAFTYKVQAEKNNGVAAIVNGEKITISEMKEAYENNLQIKAYGSFEDIYPQLLDMMVSQKLSLQAATAANIQATPEYQKYLALMQDEIARQVYLDKQVEARVTDEKVKEYYENEYLAKFEPQKEIKAKHILVKEEDLAKDIIAKLNDKKASFDDLAKQYSKDNPDLGYFVADEMVPEFSEAVMKIEPNNYSKEPVKTQFGYHVILVEDIRDTEPLSFDELKDQIKVMLSQQAAVDIFKELNEGAKVEKFDLNGKKIETK